MLHYAVEATRCLGLLAQQELSHNKTHLKHLALVLGTVAVNGDRYVPVILVLVLEPQARPQRHLRAQNPSQT